MFGFSDSLPGAERVFGSDLGENEIKQEQRVQGSFIQFGKIAGPMILYNTVWGAVMVVMAAFEKYGRLRTLVRMFV